MTRPLITVTAITETDFGWAYKRGRGGGGLVGGKKRCWSERILFVKYTKTNLNDVRIRFSCATVSGKCVEGLLSGGEGGGVNRNVFVRR